MIPKRRIIHLLLLALTATHAEDLSKGAYGPVFARRLLASWDKDNNGSIEKAEFQQWRLYGRSDMNRNDSLSLEELSKVTVPTLSSKGEQKLNLLYKKTAEEDLYLDLYYPEKRSTTKLPIIIYTHGGGWTTGSKQNIAFGAFSDVHLKWLDAGFAVAAVNYRLWKPEGSVAMRDCVVDAKDAIRYLAKNSATLGLDPMRCFVHGDSAGGHIAQMLLLSSPTSLPGDPSLAGATYRMIAGVSWYGPCDFQKPELFNAEGARDRFGPRILKPGTDPKDQPTLYREMSPVQYLSPASPPLLMIQGDKDTTIPVKHALHMQEKAKAAKAPVEIIVVKNAGHNWREAGGAIEPGIDAIVDSTVKFLVDRLKVIR
ncbi:MAG: alpha/beta hydrolase fold domain-containing protein [Prosthecobacter sp.]|jgi:acetyl esterase/lipase